MWRFVHLTDLHLGSVVDGQWNNRFLCSMMPEVMRCLRRDLVQLAPDFLLVTGDIASQQTRDAVFAARDFLDDLKIPYFPLGGNHDFLRDAGRGWFLDAFGPNLPEGDTVYSFTHKQLHFCALDAWWRWADGALAPVSQFGAYADEVECRGRWAIPPHEFAWLEDDLERHRNLKSIVAVHYPAVPIPERLRKHKLKDAGSLDNGEILMETFARHPQVKAVFSGHLHMNFIEQQNGVTHVVTSALPEFPTEYREVQVYDDRLEIHTRGLSDSTFATRSLISGNAWTAGHPADRTAVVWL